MLFEWLYIWLRFLRLFLFVFKRITMFPKKWMLLNYWAIFIRYHHFSSIDIKSRWMKNEWEWSKKTRNSYEIEICLCYACWQIHFILKVISSKQFLVRIFFFFIFITMTATIIKITVGNIMGTFIYNIFSLLISE